LARLHGVRWAACGGSMLGAMCYHAMVAWDDDMDLSVPQADCEKLDTIWETATPIANLHRNDGWQPRLTHFGLAVWRASTGEAATNGHRKFTIWEPSCPLCRALLSIDVMCTAHQIELTAPGGAPVAGMVNYTAAVLNGDVAPVEFGPTTILQVPRSIALEYIKVRHWDADCGEMPPLGAEAAAALARFEANAGARLRAPDGLSTAVHSSAQEEEATHQPSRES